MLESAQEDKKTASKPGDKLEMPVLDRGGSKRALNSLNGDEPETTILDRGDKRAPNSLNNGDKPDKNLTDNANKDSDWPRLIPKEATAD